MANKNTYFATLKKSTSYMIAGHTFKFGNRTQISKATYEKLKNKPDTFDVEIDKNKVDTSPEAITETKEETTSEDSSESGSMSTEDFKKSDATSTRRRRRRTSNATSTSE